jgi:uncharacterized coiled-coil protein SlyX
MSKFQDDCIARLNEQVKQDQIIIKKLSDQRDELVCVLDEARAGLIEWMSEYNERVDETDDNLLAKIDDLIQKARTA